MVIGLHAPTVISTGQPLPHDLPAPLTEVAVKGRKAREIRDPEAQAEEGHRAQQVANP